MIKSALIPVETLAVNPIDENDRISVFSKLKLLPGKILTADNDPEKSPGVTINTKLENNNNTGRVQLPEALKDLKPENSVSKSAESPTPFEPNNNTKQESSEATTEKLVNPQAPKIEIKIPKDPIHFKANPQYTGVFDFTSIKSITGTKWANPKSKVQPFLVGDYIIGQDWDNILYLLDKLTGKTVWKLELHDTYYHAIAYAKGKIIIGDESGYVYSIKLEDGSINWETKVKDLIAMPLVIEDDVIYLTDHEYDTYAIDFNTGELLWNYTFIYSFNSGPTVNKDKVYVSSPERYLYALDKKTGKFLWKTYLHHYSPEPVAVSKDIIILGNNNETINALDADTGHYLWTFSHVTPEDPDHIGSLAQTPVIKNDTVYYSNCSYTFFALDLFTGKVKWKKVLPYWTRNGLVATKDALYFAGKKVETSLSEEYLVGIDQTNGNILFDYQVSYFALLGYILLDEESVYFNTTHGLVALY